MKQVKACGFILFRHDKSTVGVASALRNRKSFLLMKHADRLDLPKGHLEPGESDLDCALREMNEETGIAIDAVEIDRDFQYRSIYQLQSSRLDHETVEKTLIIFLGWVDFNTQITITEHLGYEWIDWNPPHHIQLLTIDPLLAEVSAHLKIDS